MKKLLLALCCCALILQGCAPAYNNYNKYEMLVIQSQTDLLKDLGHFDENDLGYFYKENQIQPHQAYAMPEQYYLVYFYSGEIIDEVAGFNNLVRFYEQEEDALPVYKVDLAQITPDDVSVHDVRIEFLERHRNNVYLITSYVNPSEITEFPYRKN